MARRRHTPEQIIRKLREADRLLGEVPPDPVPRPSARRFPPTPVPRPPAHRFPPTPVPRPPARKGDLAKRSTKMVTEVPPVDIDVSRHRHGTFEPKIVRKRRIDGVDALVLSLTAKGVNDRRGLCPPGGGLRRRHRTFTVGPDIRRPRDG